jgi:hypothetical protein
MQIWQAGNWRGIKYLRKPRYLIGAIAAVALLAIGILFVVLRGGPKQVIASAAEEPCSTESVSGGGTQAGYLRTILLCSVDSLRCRPDRTRVVRALHADSWNTQAMLIPDIPEGYVITGGDLLNPSAYRIRNLGFDRIKITNYTSANDYCTQHYWYYIHADHISPEPEDRARISICVYYGKWQGDRPEEPCPYPTENPQ